MGRSGQPLAENVFPDRCLNDLFFARQSVGHLASKYPNCQQVKAIGILYKYFVVSCNERRLSLSRKGCRNSILLFLQDCGYNWLFASKRKAPQKRGIFSGANDGAWTHGTLGHNQVLYQLSYIRHEEFCFYRTSVTWSSFFAGPFLSSLSWKGSTWIN